MNSRTLSILALLSIGAAGCINNDASVRVFGLCTPPEPSDSGGCLYPAACDTLALGRLAADVASTSIDGPLVWPVQINNQRASNADRAGAVETAYANIQGYKITYHSDVVTAPEQDVRALPGEHPIDPNGTTVVLVPVITRAAGTFLSGQIGATPVEISANIRVYGTYGDGTSFETGPLSVEATLCNGCFPSVAAAPAAYCGDPANPVVIGVCPQERQSAMVTCGPPATP